MVSIQVLATPMMGLARSSSVKADAFQHGAGGRAVAALGDGIASDQGVSCLVNYQLGCLSMAN
jgi:hypothetical protein